MGKIKIGLGGGREATIKRQRVIEWGWRYSASTVLLDFVFSAELPFFPLSLSPLSFSSLLSLNQSAFFSLHFSFFFHQLTLLSFLFQTLVSSLQFSYFLRSTIAATFWFRFPPVGFFFHQISVCFFFLIFFFLLFCHFFLFWIFLFWVWFVCFKLFLECLVSVTFFFSFKEKKWYFCWFVLIFWGETRWIDEAYLSFPEHSHWKYRFIIIISCCYLLLLLSIYYYYYYYYHNNNNITINICFIILISSVLICALSQHLGLDYVLWSCEWKIWVFSLPCKCGFLPRSCDIACKYCCKFWEAQNLFVYF